MLSSFGPMVPDKAKALFAAGLKRDYEGMIRLQHYFRDLGAVLFGPLRGETRIDGAYDKILVRLGGFEAMPLRLLSPYHGFSEAQYQACKQRLQQHYPDGVI